MSKIRNLNRLAYFAAVVETGSFTKAAERLGVTKAVVSAQVTQLEQELKTALLVRNTRKVSPTDAGLEFFAHCASILHEAEDAFSALSERTQSPVGTLRLTAPNDYGTEIVAPVVTAFRRKYPDCQVELYLGDAHSDLMAGELDLAIRVGWLRDSALQARKIGRFRQVLVGASDRQAEHRRVTHPEALPEFPFVANSVLADPLHWSFTDASGHSVKVRMTSDLFIDSAPAILRAVTAGAGLAILPDFLVDQALRDGRVTEVLPEWSLPEGGVFTVFPAARFRPAKVSAFTEMLRTAESKRHRKQS